MSEKGKKRTDEDEVPGGNINQIRDILVGPFQREQETRLSKLEKALERYHKESATATERAQERLEKRIDATSEKLAAKIAEASKTFRADDKALAKELDAVNSEMSSRLDDLQAKTAAELKDLEKLADDNVRALRDDVEAGVAELRDAKVGREDLGDYLMEIGLRLKGESSLKSIQNSLKGGSGAAAHS